MTGHVHFHSGLRTTKTPTVGDTHAVPRPIRTGETATPLGVWQRRKTPAADVANRRLDRRRVSRVRLRLGRSQPRNQINTTTMTATVGTSEHRRPTHKILSVSVNHNHTKRPAYAGYAGDFGRCLHHQPDRIRTPEGAR